VKKAVNRDCTRHTHTQTWHSSEYQRLSLASFSKYKEFRWNNIRISHNLNSCILNICNLNSSSLKSCNLNSCTILISLNLNSCYLNVSTSLGKDDKTFLLKLFSAHLLHQSLAGAEWNPSFFHFFRKYFSVKSFLRNLSGE